jgi:hypothetical protein
MTTPHQAAPHPPSTTKNEANPQSTYLSQKKEEKQEIIVDNSSTIILIFFLHQIKRKS